MDFFNKIKDIDDMAKIAAALKAEGKTISATGGCFDLLHPGHLHSLYHTKAQGDVSLIMLNSDASIKRHKGEKRPVMPQDARSQMMAALYFVDYVIIFNEDNPGYALSKIQPTYFCKGEDYDPEKGGIPIAKEENDAVEKCGIKMVYLPFVKDNSTSIIINKILESFQ